MPYENQIDNTNEAKSIDLKSTFLRIAIISIINTILIYSNANFGLYFWLAISQFIDSIWIDQSDNSSKMIYLVASLSISNIFILLNYLFKKGYKIAFKIAFILYLLDTGIFIYFFDILSILTHIVVLKMSYDFMKSEEYKAK